MKKYIRFSFLIGLLLSLALMLPLAAQEESGPPQVGLRPDAPQYALHGPHWVGVHEFTLDAEHREKPLEIVAWYPALNPDGLKEVITYSTFVQMDTEEGYAVEIYGHALRDAIPNLSAAPYPVILVSHASIDTPYWIAWLGEHLASYGFTVIAPLHRELAFLEADDYSTEAYANMERPRDMTAILAKLDTLNKEGYLAGTMDTENIGVTGWDIGGTTTLATGGARFSLDELAVTCAEPTLEDEYVIWICGLLLDNREYVVELAGFETEPEGLWPTWSDPRVKAIAPLASNSFIFGKTGLAAITVPVLAMNGSDDTPEWGALTTYNNSSSTEKALVLFDHAGHFIFETRCEDSPILYEWGITDMCSDPVWDMQRAQDLTNHLETAFFLAELKDDSEARAALAPDAVDFPGVTYKAEGF